MSKKQQGSMYQISYNLPIKAHEAINTTAAELGVSRSKIIRDLEKNYLPALREKHGLKN